MVYYNFSDTIRQVQFCMHVVDLLPCLPLFLISAISEDAELASY